MNKQENHQDLGRVIFDNTINQFAILLEVYQEHDGDAWQYVLEYVDGKKRERFLIEIDLHPVKYALFI